MPTFNFLCNNENKVHTEEYIFEELVLNNEDVICPVCKSKSIKLFSPNNAISFKGEGWTIKSSNYIGNDRTSAIRDHVKEMENNKKNYTTEELYNPQGKHKNYNQNHE